MQADFSVELGREDPALEVPWTSADPQVRYYDLKNHPELVQQIPEAVVHPELGSFLLRINAPAFPLATAKCDTWSSEEVAPEEEIFGDRKFVSYVDLVFVKDADRCSFEKHEALAKDLCRLLGRAPEIAATVEFVIRHCYYGQERLVCESQVEHGDTSSQRLEKGRTASLQPCNLENDQNVNQSERPNSRVKDPQTAVASGYARPPQQATLEARFQSKEESQSKEKSQSEGRAWSEDKVESPKKVESPDRVEFQDRVESKDKVQSEDKVESEEEILLENKVWGDHRVQSEDKVRFENQSRLEDAIASSTGFCLTTYVTGFGDTDRDPVLRWTIGLSLLQHAIVQLTGN